MAGVCSRHHPSEGVIEGCVACNTGVPELLGISEAEYAYMQAEAEDAGLFECECGFEYYKTTDSCPLCSAERKIIIP